MFSQTRDVAMTPAGQDLYDILHNYTAEQLSSFFYGEMVHMIGNFVGIFLSGIALTLGVSSILLLSSKRVLSRQETLLRAFTIVLLPLAISFQIQALLNTFLPMMYLSRTPDQKVQDNVKSTAASDMILAVMAAMTDGLLVWRCFMVQRGLGNGSSKWGNIFWILPALLWLTTIGIVASTGIVIFQQSPWYDTASILGFGGNLLLNLYATVFISTRLLLHRRMAVACVGKSKLTSQYLYLIGILLESAAVNLPVTALCAIGFGIGAVPLINTMVPIAVANQVLASILIIHQSALGKVLYRERESEVKNSVEIAGHRTPRYSESIV